MMQNIKLNLKNSNIQEKEIMSYAEDVAKIHEELHKESKDETQFLGWLNLPTNQDKKELEKIKKVKKKIQADSDILVVIGIGGSYLGARAIIESLKNTFYNRINR